MNDRLTPKQIQDEEARSRSNRWSAFYQGQAVQHPKASASAVSTYPVLESEVFQFLRQSFPDAQESLIEQWHEAEPPTYENYRHMDGQSHRLILEGIALSFKRWAILQAKITLPDPQWLELERSRTR